ncbi:MAG: hypothetical protein CMP57_03765 [Flavobacteriales bacterium]|nr:hypothetical protein [Flavobacteriales bacterium]|tara:strand:- start:7301 stop:7816 length:516 start_codon:yes stop_codon:yes gene_type:complete
MANIKYKLLTFSGLLICGTLYNSTPVEDFCLEGPIERVFIEKEKEEFEKTDLLLEAMIQVESRGKEGSVGDKHLGRPSIGVLQIRPIMVKEVNRILKKRNIKKKYKLDDRYSREKSIEMFYIWKDYYHSEDSEEVIARCWNGGPKGWKRKATEHYWSKVKTELNKLVGRSA